MNLDEPPVMSSNIDIWADSSSEKSDIFWLVFVFTKGGWKFDMFLFAKISELRVCFRTLKSKILFSKST